jgi:hypothetical protein
VFIFTFLPLTLLSKYDTILLKRKVRILSPIRKFTDFTIEGGCHEKGIVDVRVGFRHRGSRVRRSGDS